MRWTIGGSGIMVIIGVTCFAILVNIYMQVIKVKNPYINLKESRTRKKDKIYYKLVKKSIVWESSINRYIDTESIVWVVYEQ